MVSWSSKHETETRTYGIDWSARIGLNTIATIGFEVTQGTVVLTGQSFLNKVASVVVSGGVEGECAEILCRMTDSLGTEYITSVMLSIRDWDDLDNEASTSSKRQIVEMAFEWIGLPGYTFDASADEMASALRRLDTLMATDQIAGLRLNYNFPAGIGKSDPDEPSGIPDYAVLGISGQLAILVSPGIGKTISREALAGFSTSLRDLRAKAICVPQMTWAGGTPSGAGNSRRLSYNLTYMRGESSVVCC